MNACNRSWVISLPSPSKTTYLFGNISPDLTPAEFEGVFGCVGKYCVHPEGSLPWAKRIVARIPAVEVPVEKENIELELCN